MSKILLLMFAGSILSLSAEERLPPISVGMSPALSFPLNEDTAFFSMGGGADITVNYRFPCAPLLSLGGGIGYSLLPVELGTAVSVLSLSASGGLVLNILPRLFATLDGYGGLYYGFLNDGSGPGSAFPFLRLAMNLNLQVSPRLSIGIGGCYRNYLGLYQGAEAGIGTRIFLGPTAGSRVEPGTEKPRPLSEAQQADRLRIKEAAFEEIFPVFFKYYDEHPIGSAVLANNGKELIQKLSVSLFIKQHMDNPKACAAPAELKPGEEQPLVLNALFTESVLQITESTKVSAEITVDYTIGKERYTDRYVETVRIYDRNATTWDDDRRAAAFVTAKDPSVLTLSKMVASLAAERGQGVVNLSLRTAMALHAALDVYGLRYVVDPKTPYKELSARKSAVDFLQFPQQSLQYRAGDCDDLSILTCALLESVGVETAFITVPGHIFVAICLPITPEEAKRTFAYVDDLVFRQDQVWIPVEVTQTRGGFLKAWQEGARQWREASARDQARFHTVHEAWTLYEPVGLPGGGEPMQLPNTDKVAALYLQELTAFAAREIYPQVAQIEAEMVGKGESPSLLNQLGILYARYGITDRAEREFARALALDTEYVPALVNVGNLQFKAEGPKAALAYYEKAYRLAPDNPTVLVSLAKANYALENYGTVNEALSRLNQIRPDLARKFAYLEMRGPEAEKAAAVGNAREEVVWAE